MKNILLATGAALLLMGTTSCTDYFLDLNPTDSQTEANYYKDAEDFEYAANSTYSFFGFKDLSGHTFYNIADVNSDMIIGVDNIAAGTQAASTTDTYWTACYTKIRLCNVVIDKGADYMGTDDITASIAVARFFRAYHYFWLMQRFGGVPLVLRSLSTESEELYAARNSRYEVMAQIIEDLDYAIDNLPDEADYDGHVTRQGAQAFKARTLLFEATWEKYVGTTTDGDGTSEGAGSTKPSDYPSIDTMLTEAASLAQEVIESGYYELWNADGTDYDHIAYNYLFNLEDANTNPMGFTKDNNREFILQIAHDHTSNRIGKNITHAICGSNTAGNLTVKLMTSFPCTSDGLPYFYSADYRGFDQLTDVFTNRDDRLTSTILNPGVTYYTMGTNGADAERYAEADYVTCFDFPSGCSVYYPVVQSTGVTGYANRKMSSERRDYSDTEESYNYPVLRLAEVYLIYAEAKCELGNGTISDDDLDYSINKLHERANVPAISNASVAQANANYLANTGNTGTLTILDLIRNERAVEFVYENQRPSDLKRWGIAEETLNTNRSGIVVKNPDGTDTQVVNFSYEVGGLTQSTWSSSVAVYGYETLEDGSQALIVNSASQFNMQRKNYLYPLPLNEIQLNPALVQNPGY
ncbi:MAG: RagB/SusD family nutrient uptake outer membrane protein [Bacteroides sp.]|nr:RagB/SusD family nutrient uptake outer membrane protein [Bacteroides sp.]